ncbi:MAG: FHA domain-containing protein [Micropruina sp.]
MGEPVYSYTPGEALAVCGERVAVLVALPPDAGLVPGLYDLIGDPQAGLDEVLELLVSPGLRAVEHFALAEYADEGLRTVVRGRYCTRAGSHTVEGRGLWADRILQADGYLLLDPEAPDSATLPLTSGGVVLAGRLQRRSGDVTPLTAPPMPSLDEPPVPPDAAPQAGAPIPSAVAGPVAPPPSPPATAGRPSFIESLSWSASAPTEALTPAEAPVLAPTLVGELSGAASERTISRDQLPADAQTVVAARCPSGHLSPADAGSCRVCGRRLPRQQPVDVPRPPLGVLRLSNGDTVVLDRGCILGRNPRVPVGYSGERPNLIKLIDPDKDISGQHLEVRLEDWHVAVKDLGSTNGTQVIPPGEHPVTLRPNDPVRIEPGTKVILAGVFSFIFDVTEGP